MNEASYTLKIEKPEEMSVEEYYDRLGKAYETVGRTFRQKAESEHARKLALSTTIVIPELNATFTIEHK